MLFSLVRSLLNHVNKLSSRDLPSVTLSHDVYQPGRTGIMYRGTGFPNQPERHDFQRFCKLSWTQYSVVASLPYHQRPMNSDCRLSVLQNTVEVSTALASAQVGDLRASFAGLGLWMGGAFGNASDITLDNALLLLVETVLRHPTRSYDKFSP